MNRALHMLLDNKQPTKSTFLVMFLVLFFIQLNGQSQFECDGQIIDEIVMDNLVLESGSNLQENAVYRQSNTYEGVDALVRIQDISSGSYLESLDYDGHGHDKAFQPIIHKNGGYSSGYVDFEVTFVESGTNIITSIPHIIYSAIDVDGDNNDLKEFVQLSGVSSFTVDTQSDLQVFDLGNNVKFVGPSYAEELHLDHYKLNGTVHSYESQGFNYRCGIQGNNGDRTRHFALYFHCLDYNNPEVSVNVGPPLAICQDVVVELDESGLASISPEDVDNNSTAEVSFSKQVDKFLFDYTDLGDNDVQLSIIDDYDQEDNCIANVRVETRDPDVICPPGITTNTNSGCYRSGLDIGVPTVSSPIPIFSITNNAPDQFFVGTTTVTWTIIDADANVVTCDQIITIIDDIFPTFVPCVPDVTVITDDDDCDYGTLLQAPIVSDNCGVVSLTSDTDYPLPLGVTTITWTVVDPSGLSATCVQNVNVVDNSEPIIDCLDEVILESEDGMCGVPGDLVPPSASDPCGIASVTSNAPAVFPIGSTDVTWTVTDNNGNVSTCMQTITVEDNLPPEIICPENIEVTTAGSSEFVNVGQPTYSDDCGIASISNSFNNTEDASGIYPLGTTAILWTVTDNSGNQSTCIMTVTVTDDTAPPIICPDNIDVNSTAGACETNVSIGVPTVEGGEILASLINNYNGTSDASDVYPVGQTVVIWTATDVNGNISTCSMLVVVTDSTPPTIACPSDINENASGGSCDANVVDLGTPVVSDACGVATVVSDAPATFPVGTTIVTWTVTDIHGNVSTCQQTVSLIDNTDPNIICPSNILVNADDGLPSAFVSVPLPNATDDCGIDSYSNDFNGTSNASDVYPIGITTVVWTVTDNNGNSASCSMTVTVEDSEGPEILCPPNADVVASTTLCDSQVTVDVPIVSDNQGIASIVNDYNGTDNASDSYPVGTTVVTWTVTDLSGLTSSCSMTVTVEDNTPPEVQCSDNLIVDVDNNACEATNVMLTPPVVSDACGIATITNSAPASYPVGSTQVTWTVTDNNGNVSTCSQNVIVEDNTVPLINCPPNVTVTTDPGVAVAAVTVAPATASDDCGIASIINDHTGTNNASGVYEIGTTIVTWVATDVNGNSVSCSMTVTVTDTEIPEVDCPPSPSVTATLGLCEAFVNIDIPTATDNDGIASLINDFNGTSDASGVYSVGVTTVVWTATDNNGNTNTCTMTVTVLDETPPNIGCPPAVSATVDQDECGSATVNLNNPSISDECVIDGATLNNDAPTFFGIGTTTVTWTVSDVNGNIATCSQDVTITDDQAPTIECPSDITVSADEGATTTFINIDLPTVSDNCGIESLLNDFNNSGNASDTYSLGITIVTWTVTDIYGNQSSCSMTVNVIDTEAPEIECPEDVSVNAAADSCEANVVINIPEVFDNDGIASLVNDFNGTDNASGTYPIGTTIVIWTVTDNAGFTNSCAMNVTVLDVTDPNLDCQEFVEFIADVGDCGVTGVPLGGVNVSDACGIASVENDAPETFMVGTNTFTWTVTDNSGNISTCETSVIVTDEESPVIECPPVANVDTDPGECVATGVDLGGVNASDNCGIASITNNAEEPYQLGTTIVTWTVTDIHGNVSLCEQEVVVTDNEDPTFIMPGDLTIDADLDSCSASGLVLDNIIAEDNCSGIDTIYNDLPDFLPLPVGTTTITWTIIDASGNEVTFTQEVIVEDNQAPEITCPDDQTVENEFRECWAVVEIEIPEATDNCNVATVINDYNNTTNATDTFYVGVTDVIWTVTDVNGNTSSCTQVITVLDTEDPSIACPPNVAVANDPGFCGAEVIVLEALASDNCEMDTLYNTYNNTDNASDYYEVGVTSVTWIAQDINGNEFTCDMNVTVVDTELPEIVCADDIVVSTDPGTCEATVTVPQPQVTDNCTYTFMNDLTGTEDASGVYTGVTTIIWSATDPSGNTASCSQIVSVEDVEPPVIDCPDNMVIPNDNGQCGAIVNYPDINYSDNCGVDSVIILAGVVSGDYLPVGDTTITYQVLDAAGNSASCSFDVSVVDVEGPQIICPDDISVVDSATVVFYDSIQVFDNCEYEVFQIDGLPSGDVFEHGITTNTFVVTDLGGNTAECSFDVLVNLPPVATDDVFSVPVSGGEIEIDPLPNDFDPDGDEFTITSYTVNLGEAILIDNEFFIYNAPENWCGTAIITYTICDIYGACDDAEILININCPEELFIPEGISPDNDGVNDTFEIIGLWQYPDNKLTVFNRWGHEIFDMAGYDNSWDGTSTDDLTLGSSPVPRGTYFYILDLGNGEEPIKGFVYILNR